MGLRLLGALILDIIWKSPASASPPFSAGSFPSRRCVMQNGYGLLLTETIGLPMKIGQPPQTQISSFQPWIVKIPIYNLYMYIYIYTSSINISGRGFCPGLASRVKIKSVHGSHDFIHKSHGMFWVFSTYPPSKKKVHFQRSIANEYGKKKRGNILWGLFLLFCFSVSKGCAENPSQYLVAKAGVT